MAVHLLLEEAVGPLTPKQVELLLAARQDSDRLLAMVNDLLDLTRIEQGRVRLDLGDVASADLVGEAVERFGARARDAGVELKAERGVRPAAGAGRSRAGRPRLRQPGRQRPGAHRPGGLDHPLGRGRRGLRPVRRGRHRRGDRGRAPAPALREVLPGSGLAIRGRGRARPGHRPRDRRGPRRPDRRGQPPRRGDDLHLPPADRPRGRRPGPSSGSDRHERRQAHPDRRRRAQRPARLPHGPGVGRLRDLHGGGRGDRPGGPGAGPRRPGPARPPHARPVRHGGPPTPPRRGQRGAGDLRHAHGQRARRRRRR